MRVGCFALIVCLPRHLPSAFLGVLLSKMGFLLTVWFCIWHSFSFYLLISYFHPIQFSLALLRPCLLFTLTVLLYDQSSFYAPPWLYALFYAYMFLLTTNISDLISPFVITIWGPRVETCLLLLLWLLTHRVL